MKVQVNLTNEAMLAVRGAANKPFEQTGKRRRDGSWDIELDRETYTALRSKKFETETLSDTLIRLIAITLGSKLN